MSAPANPSGNPTDPAPAHQLDELAWTEVDRPLVVVPLGSCEQHGPHLPLGTDTVIASSLCRALAARRAGTIVAPPIGVAASGEHRGFPGTLSIGSEVVSQVLIELVRSAEWAHGVVVVNGHGGNFAALSRAYQVICHEQRPVLLWSPRLTDADLHAGHVETSLMLALEPALVRLERATSGPQPRLDELAQHGVRHFSPSGVLGDPTGADHRHGQRLFDELLAQLTSAVDRWASAPVARWWPEPEPQHRGES